MKNAYEKPELAVEKFDVEDIVTQSSTNQDINSSGEEPSAEIGDEI